MHKEKRENRRSDNRNHGSLLVQIAKTENMFSTVSQDIRVRVTYRMIEAGRDPHSLDVLLCKKNTKLYAICQVLLTKYFRLLKKLAGRLYRNF